VDRCRAGCAQDVPRLERRARAAALAARRAKAKDGPDDPEAAAEEADGFAASFIRRYEGFSADAYPDPATGGEPWTVGFGSTRGPDGKPVRKGDRVTEEQANELLLRDMYGEAKKLAEKVPWAALSPRQRAALMSWAYNVGGAAASGSTAGAAAGRRRRSGGRDPRGAAPVEPRGRARDARPDRAPSRRGGPGFGRPA
jgi:GH24 family phage-related lysozyme (muramidase)